MENEPGKHHYYDEYEIDLREYIMLLWNHKLFIGLLVVLAVAAAFSYSTFLTEPVYQAKSTLLILQPKYTTSLEVESFSVDTYRNLATTDSIKKSVIKELNLKNEDGELYTVNQLESMMSLEILAVDEEANGNNPSNNAPLIELRVQNKDPELASKIANAWAQNFISDSKEIRQNEVKEVATVIQEQFEDTEQKLNNLKSELLTFNKENRLSLLRQRLNNKIDKLNSYNETIINLKTKLGAKNTEYENLEQQISSMEKDGVWIGELNNEKYETGKYELLKIKGLYTNAQTELMEFKQNNDLSLMQSRIKSVRNNIINYKEKIKNLNNQLINLEEENYKLSKIIKEENKRWILNRSIDNNTLWHNVLSENEMNVLEELQLKDEIINPVYQKAKKKQSDNKVIISKIPMLMKHYQKEVKKEEEHLAELNNKYHNLQLKRNKLNVNLSNYKKSYDNYRNKYQNLTNKKLELDLEIEELRAELSYYQNIEKELTSEIKNMQNELWEGKNRKEILQQKINDVQNTYNSLAKRVEEARITEAQRTSDVKFYSEAVTPSTPMDSNRMLNIAIAAVLALMLAVFIVFFKEFMKEEK